MEHFYKETSGEGWFDYENVYSSLVNEAPETAHFVEVGTWKGMSASYMAVEIINSGKNIKFDCIDTWNYVATSCEIPEENFNDLFNIFLKNIEPVKDHIGIIRELSWEGAKHFNDNSLDFVFIDAAHDYESVLKDITAWYPKVKPGGTIGGHDYHWNTGVYNAVNEYLKDKTIGQNKACWLYKKEI
jgi:predicted O-methyltransferase YrrM